MDLKTARIVLGVEAGASFSDVKTAHRDLVKMWHPDRHGADEAFQARASRRLQDANEAFRIVVDSLAREGHGEPERHESPDPRPSPAAAAPDASRPGQSWPPWLVVTGLGTVVMSVVAALMATPASMRTTAVRLASERRSEEAAAYRALGDPAAARRTIAESFVDTSPTSFDYAGSPTALHRQMEGRWSLDVNATGTWLRAGAFVEFRGSTAFVGGGTRVYAFYRSETARALRLRQAATGEELTFDVWFPSPDLMTWAIRAGEREQSRLIFSRAGQ